MEDVRQLVGDDELQPVVVEAQRRRVDGRLRVDDDAVRRQRRREAVRDVAVVGQTTRSTRSARRAQLAREQSSTPLPRPPRRGAPAPRARRRRARGSAASSSVRQSPRGSTPCAHAARAASASVRPHAAARSARPRRRTPHRGHSRGRGSTPRARRRSPRAYSSRPCGERIAASCSGSIRNSPSVSTAGIHGGRATARFW